MSLKQSIVVKSRYSTKNNKTGKGSRGATPGSYVTRYMARKGATELITPVKLYETDKYITRYMARKEATEKYNNIGRIKDGMHEAQGLGGVAFGSFGKYDDGDISLSDAKIKALSKHIQDNFDKGKTAIMPILSFTNKYLKEHGIVSEDFEPKMRGDYRGNIDQLKLRLAIMQGMKKMGEDYDDLAYVGVIQVDTMHVHCHLTMIDKGKGHIMPSDGRQKGKISEASKRKLRRYIDNELDYAKSYKRIVSNISYDKLNVKSFIKKYTHGVMEKNGFFQMLVACLPENKNLWRASTNAKPMKKANAIVKEYVEQLFEEPNSGYDEVIKQIDEYALNRMEHEGFDEKYFRKLQSDGRKQILNDCMNAVYSSLRTIPDARKKIRTPMLDIMTMDYDDMAKDIKLDPMIEFGFRLRSYSSRLQYHKKERDKYHELKTDYEKLQKQGRTGDDSIALFNFYKFEEEYNTRLMCKYQNFLGFLPHSDKHKDDFEDLMLKRKKIKNFKLMMNDKDIKRMEPDKAEEYGKKVYESFGGRFVKLNPNLLQTRFNQMLESYAEDEDAFRYDLHSDGLSLDIKDKKIFKQLQYPFEEVKALDIHHLGYDFMYDVNITQKYVDQFVKVANMRNELRNEAISYFEGSNQEDFIDTLPNKDVDVMKEMADRFNDNNIFKTLYDGELSGKHHKTKTIRLDDNFEDNVKFIVKNTLDSMKD